MRNHISTKHGRRTPRFVWRFNLFEHTSNLLLVLSIYPPRLISVRNLLQILSILAVENFRQSPLVSMQSVLSPTIHLHKRLNVPW
jgi:hypothetical protein